MRRGEAGALKGRERSVMGYRLANDNRIANAKHRITSGRFVGHLSRTNVSGAHAGRIPSLRSVTQGIALRAQPWAGFWWPVGPRPCASQYSESRARRHGRDGLPLLAVRLTAAHRAARFEPRAEAVHTSDALGMRQRDVCALKGRER